jgi:hypothetical protein
MAKEPIFSSKVQGFVSWLEKDLSKFVASRAIFLRKRAGNPRPG